LNTYACERLIFHVEEGYKRSSRKIELGIPDLNHSSGQLISTWNYGKIVTSLTTEWNFAAEASAFVTYPGQTGRSTKWDAQRRQFFEGREPIPIADLMQSPECVQACLTRVETIGLRLYTGLCGD